MFNTFSTHANILFIILFLIHLFTVLLFINLFPFLYFTFVSVLLPMQIRAKLLKAPLA